MACRDMKRAEEAAEDIRKQAEGLQGVGEIIVTRLDLGSLASVRECVQHLLRTEPHINLLVNNAGKCLLVSFKSKFYSRGDKMKT